MAEDLELYSLLEVLKMSTRQIYEEELSGISDSVYAMSADVEKAIDKTLFAFQNMSVSLSNEIMKHDDRIDTMEYQIEERCISIVIKQQPLASDWRKISSYMRMIADMRYRNIWLYAAAALIIGNWILRNILYRCFGITIY